MTLAPNLCLWWTPEGRTSLVRPAKAVHTFDGAFLRKARALRELFLQLPDAAGLAANQVNWKADVFVAKFTAEAASICVNARLSDVSDATDLGWEGCLSVPGFRGICPRPLSVRLHYQDERGVPHVSLLSDFAARLACHEVDHLAGRTYLTRLLQPAIVRVIDNTNVTLNTDLEVPAAFRS